MGWLRAFWRRCVLPAFAVACGPISGADSSSSESGGDEPTPLECDTPAAGIDPFAGDPECNAYFDVGDNAPQIEVRILNRTDAPLVIANRTVGCMPDVRYFDIEGTMGGRAVRGVTQFCPSEWNSCFVATGDFEGCLLCGTLFAERYLAPGGSFSESWNAWVVGGVVMPGACADSSDTISCTAGAPIAAGEFTATARAMVLEPESTDCTCTPDELGTCAVESCTFVENATAAARYYGTCETLEIVFE